MLNFSAYRRRRLKLPWLKPVAFLLCSLPLLGLVWRVFYGDLGANPVETVSRYTGSWTLNLLLATLAVTPAVRLTRINALMRIRRMLGLWTFAYALVHFLAWLVLDQFFAWTFIVEDILERPFITVGFLSFLLLIPLAATSTDAAIRRLGGIAWQRLHRLVYLAAVGGVIHFLWLVKADLREPLIYGAVLAGLLGFRVVDAVQRRSRRVQVHQT